MENSGAEKPTYVVEKGPEGAVCLVRIEVPTTIKNWEQPFLFMADIHWDNPKCRLDVLTKHLQEAKDRGAGILIFGDLFCAMQGKWDKRSSKSDIRPEHMEGSYLDRLVETAAEFFAPYADNMVLVGLGNHETAILKKHETNLSERLVTLLRAQNKSPALLGGYRGWVKFMFQQKTERKSLNLFYTHGYGGGGPVTQDMIQGQRMWAAVEADLYVFGHTHDRFTNERVRMRLNNAHYEERRSVEVIKTPTYKDEWGSEGFAAEKGMWAKPIGGTWVKFRWDREDGPIWSTESAK